MAKPKIETFVFLDIEASGLDDSHVTELCMIAVHRNALLEANSVPTSGFGSQKTVTLPRLMDKLLLCCDPQTEITEEASGLSGITNDLVESVNLPPFDKTTASTINTFLERQHSPVCLISHSGIRFDFRVLRAEMRKAGSSLPSDLLCADTFLAFKETSIVRSGSLALRNLHPRFVSGGYTTKHNAEGDVIALIELTICTREHLISYFDRRASPISNVPFRW